jgi:toxin ParE1/3/4
MKQIQFTNAARQDLKSIFAYSIRTWGRPQAQRYAAQLKQHIEKIAQGAVFTKPVANSREHLHQSAVGRHLIIFEVKNSAILIVRILHEAMDMPRHISQKS